MKDLDLDANRLSCARRWCRWFEMHISDVKTGSGRHRRGDRRGPRQWRKARELDAIGPIGEEALVFSSPTPRGST